MSAADNPLNRDREWRRFHGQARGQYAVLAEEFVHSNKDARNWERAGRYRREATNRLGESTGREYPDCDVMARAFTAFARERGYDARTVKLAPPEPQPWYGDHWITVIQGTGVDWTARQFYNVAENDADWIKPTYIPAPLYFPWPGTYPIPGMTLVQVELEPVTVT